jgi:GSH-dependent disulfide-bond oxidoreductase
MIDLHYWTSPNGHKITMFLEGTRLPYWLVPIEIAKNAQFEDEFLKISPNNKIPAIVDRAPLGDGEPLSIFESGAIPVDLAKRTGQLLPQDARGQSDALQWSLWLVAGLGPMAGQLIFFLRSSEKIRPAIDRYWKETDRLYLVLNKQLESHEWLAGTSYSVADISTYTWAALYSFFGLSIEDYPAVERWLEAVASRPATQRAYSIAKQLNPQAPMPVRRAERLASRRTG